MWPPWDIPEWWKPIAILLVLPAFLLAVIGLTTSNPTSVGQEGRVARSPEGIVRVTRHPFLIGSDCGRWCIWSPTAMSPRSSSLAPLPSPHWPEPCRLTPSVAARLVPAGRPSRRKPLSSRSPRLLPAVPCSTPVRSQHGDGSPPSLPTH